MSHGDPDVSSDYRGVPEMYPRRMAKKRGYSRDFKPHGDTGKRYLLDKIPAGLWREAREKAKREGVSMRALLLRLLERWVRE